MNLFSIIIYALEFGITYGRMDVKDLYELLLKDTTILLSRSYFFFG